ncbi:hypothetical protein Tco_1363618 [Tanacetum coccineum]
MAKIQEVLPEESSSTEQPLEQVQNNDDNNVFANERQHFKNNTVECADERAALANLIVNLTLDTEENKTILKQLKKVNALLTQELKECRTNLDETELTLIRLNKHNKFEKYKAFNDRTIDYDILQTKLNETLGLLALKDIEIEEGLCNTPKMGRSGIWVGECYFIDQQHEIGERPLYESFKIDTLD